MARVTIVDYGVGNLLSVTLAFEKAGAEVVMAETPEAIAAADRLVLPGVGAFADGMQELASRGYVEPIREFAASGKPMIGICLGMQMLLDSSEDFGETRGLGLIPGRVVAIPPRGADGEPHKIPHIGWNELQPIEGGVDWSGTILDGVEPGVSAYFVHSFTAQPAEDRFRLADCSYDGCRVSAAIAADNVYGTQFHPERSGPAGLAVVESFLRL